MAPESALPEGTVTFLFSDIEGSTQLLEAYPELIAAALGEHHAIFERVVTANRGVIFETVGDAVYAAFEDPTDAIATALDAQRTLAQTDWGPIARIACRLAVHTGPVDRRGDHYVGPALFRCARLQSLGYGEQTLLTNVTADLVADHLPTGAGLRDLGLHRLKDLAEPEHVFMLVHPDLRDAFPPPKSVALHPNNLPSQLSTFVGRSDELNEIATEIADHRLVTLLGAGGVGKTRLAIAVASQILGRFPDGTFFVDLAPTDDVEKVGQAIADVIGVRGTPTSSVDEALGAWLRSRTTLLVLDNLEQIAGVGPSVRDLLETAPSIRILATSRVPLRVRGERRMPVNPLAVPARGATESDMRSSPAVGLFLDRAADAGWQLGKGNEIDAVAEISRRLDGLPLAIELAAARTTIFEPAILVRHLDERLDLLADSDSDRPIRQQTLEATVRWSYDLLTDAARDALLVTASFEGGWSLEAWQGIGGVSIDAVTELVDAALVNRRGDRFMMLETIHAFVVDRASERSAAEQDALGERHADWFLAWLLRERLGPAVPEGTMLPEVMTERANLDVAARVLAAREDRAAIRELGGRMWLFWLTHGQIAEGKAWIEAGMGTPPPLEPVDQARMYAILGEFAGFSGDTLVAIQVKEQGLELARQADDAPLQGVILHGIAIFRASLGEFDEARRLAHEAFRLEQGSAEGRAHALGGLGDVELQANDPAQSLEFYRRAEAVVEPDSSHHLFVVDGIAECHRRLGDLAAASTEIRRTLARVPEREDALLGADALEIAAAILRDLGRYADSAAIVAATDRIDAENGLAPHLPQVRAAVWDSVRGVLPMDELDASIAMGRSMNLAEACRYASAALA